MVPDLPVSASGRSDRYWQSSNNSFLLLCKQKCLRYVSAVLYFSQMFVDIDICFMIGLGSQAMIKSAKRGLAEPVQSITEGSAQYRLREKLTGSLNVPFI